MCIGWQWVGKGIQQYLSNPPVAMAEVHARSDFMAGRASTQFRELNELRNRVQDQNGILQAVQGPAYWMMMQAQQTVDIPTWLGAYEKAVAEGNDDERAVALSDQAVIDAQGDGAVKDLATIQRGGPTQKLFTVFYSFMNTALNLSTNTVMSPKERGKKAADLMAVLVVPTMLGVLLRNALVPGDSGDDKDWKTLLKKLLGEQLGFLFGLMVITREVAEAGKAVAGLSDHPRDYAGPAGVRVLVDLTQAAKQIAQGEFDDQLRKSMINLLGDVAGLPAAQINRTITGVKALKEGKTQNPLAVAFGYQEPP